MKKVSYFRTVKLINARVEARTYKAGFFIVANHSLTRRAACHCRALRWATPAQTVCLTSGIVQVALFVCTFVKHINNEKSTQTVLRLTPQLRRRNRHAQGANSAPRSRTCQNLPRLHLAPRSDDRGSAVRNSTRGEVKPHFPTFYFSTFNLPAPFAG